MLNPPADTHVVDGETLALLDEARALNSQLFTLPRLEILSILNYYWPDGVQFRELKAALRMTDGKLLTNIYALGKMGYVKSEKGTVGTKSLTNYRITTEGRLDLAKVRSWLQKWAQEGTE